MRQMLSNAANFLENWTRNENLPVFDQVMCTVLEHTFWPNHSFYACKYALCWHGGEEHLYFFLFNGCKQLFITEASIFTNRAARVVLISVVSVCVFVCLSVNTITPKPLEISSRNF